MGASVSWVTDPFGCIQDHLVSRRATRECSEPQTTSEKTDDNRQESTDQQLSRVSRSNSNKNIYLTSQNTAITDTSRFQEIDNDQRPNLLSVKPIGSPYRGISTGTIKVKKTYAREMQSIGIVVPDGLPTSGQALTEQRPTAKRRTSERLQARVSKTGTRDEIQSLGGNQPRVLPDRDFRIDQEHLERLLSPSRELKSVSGVVRAPERLSPTRDASQWPSSKDFRVTADVLQSLFTEPSNSRRSERLETSKSGRQSENKRAGSAPYGPQKALKSKGKQRSKRHTTHEDDLLVTEPSHGASRRPRNAPSPEDTATKHESSGLDEMSLDENQQDLEDRSTQHELSKPSRYSFVKSGISTLLGLVSNPVSGKGTRDDPIVLDFDEAVGEDVEMAYDVPDTQKSTKPTRECAVCGDASPIADLPSLMKCAHRAETCALCFARWIESELSTKGWKGIGCPDAKCTVLLAHHEVQLYASSNVFAQYDSFAMRDALGHMPNFRWCQNPGCGSGQENDEEGYIFTCIACGHKTCTIHDVDWHENETCEEYTYRVSVAKERDQRAQEEASIAAIKTMSKKCPGMDCAFNIQKNAGCDHMTCKYRSGSSTFVSSPNMEGKVPYVDMSSAGSVWLTTSKYDAEAIQRICRAASTTVIGSDKFCKSHDMRVDASLSC